MNHPEQDSPIHEIRPAEVVYEIYPSSFRDSNNDGIGDIDGIIEKLAYVKNEVGADAIWIAPFFLSPEGPEGDGGYAVSNYREIAPRFGTVEKFQKLLAKAHEMGLRVYTDFVIAHTSDQHDWFKKSAKREEPYTDYYVWSDGEKKEVANPDGSKKIIHLPPNNWKSVFGGPAWEWNGERQQFYMHHFLKTQPKLNLNSSKVQDAALAEMKFWLDMGVDGVRIDALTFSNHDPQLRNNPWRFGQWPNVREDWDQQEFLYSMCQPQTIELIAKVRALMDTYPTKKTTLGETIAGPDGGYNAMAVAPKYVDPKKGLDMCYTDAPQGISPDNPSWAREVIRSIAENFKNGGHCNALSTHDSVRTATRIADKVAPEHQTAAFRETLRLFAALPGSLSFMQGDELGLPQAQIGKGKDIPPDKIRDPVTSGPSASRDGCRTPMPWEAGRKNAGFSDSDNPYLPVAQAHKNLAVDRQKSDPDSTLNFTHNLLAWRKSQSALVRGDTIVLDTGKDSPVVAFLRRSQKQTLLCAFNLSASAVSFKPADMLSEKMMNTLSYDGKDVITLGAYSSLFNSASTAAPAAANDVGEAPRKSSGPPGPLPAAA
jgi:alpha-glucosidase